MTLHNDRSLTEILAHEKNMRPEFHKLITSEATQHYHIDNYMEMQRKNLGSIVERIREELPDHPLGNGGNFNKNLIVFDREYVSTHLGGRGADMSPDEVRTFLKNIITKLQEMESQIKGKTFQQIQWDIVGALFKAVGMVGTGFGVATAFLNNVGLPFAYLAIFYGTAAAFAFLIASIAIIITALILILKYVANTVTSEFLLFNVDLGNDLIIEDQTAVDGKITYVPPLNPSQYGIPHGMARSNNKAVVFADFMKARKRVGSIYGTTGAVKFNLVANGNVDDSYAFGWYNGNKSSSKNGINFTPSNQVRTNLKKWVNSNWKKWRGHTQTQGNVIGAAIDAPKGGEVGGVIVAGVF